MPELLLVRHSQAKANRGDFAAFGNKESPLTEKGRIQCVGLRTVLKEEYGIDPEMYTQKVAVSEYVRPQETAREVGFTAMDICPVLNEPDFSRGTMTGLEIVRKHRKERWAPDEARIQARDLLDMITSHRFPYFLAFTHGIFTASVLLELEEAGHDMSSYNFDPKRGYVPLQAGVTRIQV